MNYIIINTKTLQCLCQTKPIDFRCEEYWDDTRFNPYLGRYPMGSAWSTSDLSRAQEKCRIYPNCEVAKYDPCANQIWRMAV